MSHKKRHRGIYALKKGEKIYLKKRMCVSKQKFDTIILETMQPCIFIDHYSFVPNCRGVGGRIKCTRGNINVLKLGEGSLGHSPKIIK